MSNIAPIFQVVFNKKKPLFPPLKLDCIHVINIVAIASDTNVHMCKMKRKNF